MDIKKACRVSVMVITVCTIVPLCVSAACKAAPKVSKTVGMSVARELNFAEKKSVDDLKDISMLVTKTARDMDAAPEEIETKTPKGEQIPTPTPSDEVIGQIPYPQGLNKHSGKIEKTNFGTYSGTQYFDLDAAGQVRNCTEISNETLYENSKLGRVFDVEVGSDEPQVLIYHTHTTETYELEDKDWFDSAFLAKTTEPDKNMTAVGDEICTALESYGITVIHDTLVHDYPSYDGAYDSSRETVSELLKKYPSVKIALDIHRDGIETQEKVRPALVTEVCGKEAAQIMIISGCDDGTMDMPNYMNNFRFACDLQSSAESLYPGFTRPILFDYRFYNQDLTDGSLLIEMGSHGNTLEQAKYSGKLLGNALGEMLTK